MKIILKQFLIIDETRNEEYRTKLDFTTCIKRFKQGELYLEICETIPQRGFIYDGKDYKKIFIGNLGSKLKIEDYLKIRQQYL